MMKNEWRVISVLLFLAILSGCGMHHHGRHYGSPSYGHYHHW